MTYRVRISGEVVAAAGQRATRRVAVEEKGQREVLEFTRAWRELERLPAEVRADARLEIEQRSKPSKSGTSKSKAEPPWRPVKRPVKRGG